MSEPEAGYTYMRCSSSTQIEVLSNEMEHRPYRRRGLELLTRSGVESPKTGSGVMAKLNAKVELAQLLDAATTHEADSLAVESDLMNRMRMIVDQWPPASLDEQRTDLLADMRELLRLTVNDPTVVDSRWFERRAHRALCQDDGIVKPGEDFVQQYRMKTRSGKWSEWLTLPEDGTFAWPQKAQGEIRLRPLTTLVCATLVCGLFALQALAQTTIQEFVTKVAISDMFEIQSGKIATQKGNANIKSFAERMVKDHTKTSQELKSMVENGKARLPTTLDGEHERQLEQLHTLEGEQFNSTYANMQIQAHEEAVTLFEEYSRSGTDLELQAWASKTLPALEERLEHAKKLK